MAYLGNTPEIQNFAAGADRFSGNASATTFTLTRRVLNANDVIAYIESVPQDPFTAYTLAANTVSGTSNIIFDSAPPAGTNNIVVNYRATQIVSYDIPTNPSITGNLTFTGTSNRIRGDFSNATLANRVMVQTSTTDAQTQLALIPNGTVVNGATVTALMIEDNTSIATGNGSAGSLAHIQNDSIRVISTIRGTGTYLPLAFHNGGSERMRVTPNGGISFGSTGTNFGTSGQILTSNGDSSPIWSSTIANTQITGRMTAAQISNTAVTPATYGGASTISVFTVDQQGRITSASNVTPSIANTQLTGTTGSGYVTLNSAPILTTPTVTNYTETTHTANTGTAITIDLANGTLQNLTCNASTTITLPASSAGKSFIIIVGYTGSFTVAWAGGSTIKWPGGTTPTATSTAGKYDIFSFFQDGINTYGQTFGLNY